MRRRLPTSWRGGPTLIDGLLDASCFDPPPEPAEFAASLTRRDARQAL